MSAGEPVASLLGGQPQLLVSVRSAAEAEAALKGGAHLIDVKEPSRGPLGRADEESIAAVVCRVAGCRPVSAALGELVQDPTPCRVPGLTYVKWGLAGGRERPDWPQTLLQQTTAGFPGVVAVAYADWTRADAPSVEEVWTFVRQRSGGMLLLDTWGKDRHPTEDRPVNLLDWLPVHEVIALCSGVEPLGYG